jgi:hypothetical protein
MAVCCKCIEKQFLTLETGGAASCRTKKVIYSPRLDVLTAVIVNIKILCYIIPLSVNG